MKIRPVSTLKGGERLSEPVITEEKEILIPKGTVLKPEYLDLLGFLELKQFLWKTLLQRQKRLIGF